jgi:hypothetical protein
MFLILSESQIIAQKPPVLAWCLSWDLPVLEVYRNNQNQWFFYPGFFHIPRTDGSFILIFQIPKTGSLILNFWTRYLNLVIIKKIQMPTQHRFWKTTFHLHTCMKSSIFSYWKAISCLEEYLTFKPCTQLIRKMWIGDKLDGIMVFKCTNGSFRSLRILAWVAQIFPHGCKA